MPDQYRPGATAAADMTQLARNFHAGAGHFNELHGMKSAMHSRAAPADLTGAWARFFSQPEARTPADLDRRYASLQRQVRDNGVTYNVYAEQEGPQRPWSLDLLPLIIESVDWQHIESGVLQRMRLLEALMRDVYGPQDLLHQGLLPPALVHGHPGYLRAMHGAIGPNSTHLYVAAFDLARGPDGLWWLVSQRSQAPSGLGYLLENRLAVARQFPQAFEELRVQRLAGTYRALMESLKDQSSAGDQAHIALLTPGPYNETYFEHAYLARYLGVSLVEGGDLIVRDECLFLKTMKGLVPIHGLLKRVDDQYMDPLELRADSTLGVPGLLQAIRAGNVLVANAPGSAFLESPALLGFLPALARHILDEELQLPSLPTWWCGERNAMEEVLPLLQEHTIKPTYPGSSLHEGFESVIGRSLNQTERDGWAGRILRQGEDHTVQAYVPLSQLPTWQSGIDTEDGRMVAKSNLLRVFAVSDGRDDHGAPRWRLLPGGLARVAGAEADIASMQRGGGSADVWALTDGVVDTTTLLSGGQLAGTVSSPFNNPSGRRKRLVTSRAAENLYWLGRYSERAENTVRLARLTLDCLSGEDQSSASLLDWLSGMALANTLVMPGVPTALQARRVFERSLIDSLGSTDGATSVGFNLRALKMAAAAVRERIAQEHWSVIVKAEEELFTRCAQHKQKGDFSATSAARVLKSCSDAIVAITGAQTDRMTRDDGWRLLSIGRHTERLIFLAASLARGISTGSLSGDGGFEAMLGLFDSTITFRGQYQQSRDMTALVDLLVMDRDNPRSLAWVAHTLRGRLARLAGTPAAAPGTMAAQVPDPDAWDLEALCATGGVLGHPEALLTLLGDLRQAALDVSDAISTTYFTHSGEAPTTLGV